MDAKLDTSTRYILGDEAPLVRNLAALMLSDARLAEALDATAPAEGYELAPTRDGAATLIAPAPGGGRALLHSRHRPKEEARATAEAVDVAAAACYFCLGFGLGHHVEALFDRAGDDALFCVFEPDPQVLLHALQSRDLVRLLRSGRLWFFTTAERGPLLARLHQASATAMMGSTLVRHEPSIRRHPAFFAEIEQRLREYESYSRTTVNTLVLNGKRTAENIARNLAWYASAPGLERLAGAGRGCPAIVVSAGPSLRRNIARLRDARGRAFIIAAQTALRPLLAEGIEPHFVTALDYHEVCAQFYEDLPRGLRTELVAEPKATSVIFDLHPGPLTLLGNDLAENVLGELRLAKPRLKPGATVAHLAFYLAEHLGCDPIILIGQDLGFTDGLYYAPGTSYDAVWRPELSRFCTMEMKQWERIVRDRAILRSVPDWSGRPLYTEERMFTYLQHFERDFAETAARVIDATEGGAMKRGARPMSLAEAIATHCRAPLPALPAHPGPDRSRLAEASVAVRRRADEAREIARVSAQTAELLREVRAHLHDQSVVNRLIARIDAQRGRVQALSRCFDLVTQLTQRSELERLRRDRAIEAQGASGVDRQRRQVERDLDNVEAIRRAAIEFASLMEGVAPSLGRGDAARGEAA